MGPESGYEVKKMIEELKSEKIVNKVGGRFKLTALVQKRLGELLQGSRPLIEDVEGKTMLEIVVQEILQDKIAIDDGLPAKISGNEKKK
jgi:DNA-directed RNA polymerase subunit omega